MGVSNTKLRLFKNVHQTIIPNPMIICSSLIVLFIIQTKSFLGSKS